MEKRLKTIRVTKILSSLVCIFFIVSMLIRCTATISPITWEQFLKNYNEQNHTKWLETDFQTKLVPPTEIHKSLASKIKTDEYMDFYQTTVVINNHTNRITQITVEEGEKHAGYISDLIMALNPSLDQAIVLSGIHVGRPAYGDIFYEIDEDGRACISPGNQQAKDWVASANAAYLKNKSTGVTWEKFLETLNQQNHTNWSDADFNTANSTYDTDKFTVVDKKNTDSHVFYQGTTITMSSKTKCIVQIRANVKLDFMSTAQLIVALNPNLNQAEVSESLQEGKLEFGDIFIQKGDDGDFFITPYY